MKYAVVFASLAALAAAAKPSFLNTDFDLKEGASFTLKFNNCQGGCTIILQNGPATNTKDVKTLTSAATGDSFTFKASDVASGTYNFKIISNTDATEFNYSKQFAYSGTGTVGASSSQSPSASSAAASSTTAASSATSSTMKSVSSSSRGSSTGSTTGSTTGSASSTASATTSMESSTATRSSATAATTIPNAGGRSASPLALVAGAVAALAYLG
ncbi:hypothetical protein E4U22_006528 [Claviceps purpurea]|uniref:Related to extracellular matrix protein n=1 Tax=Claviceps purpurea (strain 20.1) TaxID=1111077 RepID=M1WBZ1_CLAP2|nr:hypothetical protein E4U12_006840 [Claviceps purpurea]CCE31358.1 related to extracellular matrix protein precursor [Claviceps purpurea 20.1]KAG6138148.1 hypothetical protein E4U38_000618 [Claviceps purpurea]KAG6151861.1 hypothetical protein E4U37_004466 [Claviceps purpurea]KAG6207486.1 hypothetical protein E4U35_000938 [Claviceps purpurea]